MGATDQFSAADVQRMLGLTVKQLEYWDRLDLVSPRKTSGARVYDFRDLIGLRTVKQLIEKGVPAGRLRRALVALNEKISHAGGASLAELRILSDGKDILVERGEVRLEPLSGQFVLNFDTRRMQEQVKVMSAAHSADDWFSAGLAYEADKALGAEAIEAYERALAVEPEKIEALINCGALQYEQGNLEKAASYFRRAVEAQPDNVLALFNLGSVLEDLGDLQAAHHYLRHAVRFDATYPDARYNLALLCERLGSFAEARGHWQAYLKLDSTSLWADYARRRLAASSRKAKSTTAR
jgi:tetratricopeptide (TPR) repeat protein